jgi:hypothetical protein
MNEYLNSGIGAVSAIIGVILGAALSYRFGIRQVLFQNRIDNKTKQYNDLFNKIRDLNTTKNELENLKCNAQLFASDTILDFLQNLDFQKGIKDKDVHDLLVIIRDELGLKRRKLSIYIHKMETTPNKTYKQ